MDKVNAILLLYSHPVQKNASTIMDHVNAFEQYSQYPVIEVNIYLGFPQVLNKYSFSVIVLHYSLFGSLPFQLKGKAMEYVRNSKNSVIVAFFQDEPQYCPERIALINTLGIRCIYTLVEPDFHDIVYRQSTTVSQIITCIPGYVSEKIEMVGKELFMPDSSRTIDVGYRGRELPTFLGNGAFEKVDIAHQFLEFNKSYCLKCDIETSEEKRIYGDDWYRFLANCKGVIGVESGATIFDLGGDVYCAYKELEQKHTSVSYEDLGKVIVLEKYEDKIYYRMISPRHFEAAALRVCQILYEGHYSGILHPMDHYIPLKKDFSNFSDVMEVFQNPEKRQKIEEKAYTDLILSERFTYKKFIQEFDQVIQQSDYMSEVSGSDPSHIREAVKKELMWLYILAQIRMDLSFLLIKMNNTLTRYPRIKIILLKLKSKIPYGNLNIGD